MNKMFYVDDWLLNIKEVHVERRSEHSVWIKGFMHKRMPVNGFGYYDTYDEAFRFLSESLESAIRSHKSVVEKKQEKLVLLMGDRIKRSAGDKNDTQQAI